MPGRSWVSALALAMGSVAIDVDLSAENDAEADPDFADCRQSLAGGEAAHLAEAPSALDVSGIELRQDLVVARLDDRRTGNAHGVYLYKTRSPDP